MSCGGKCQRNKCPLRHDTSGELAHPKKRMNGQIVYSGRIARTGILHYPWGMAKRDAAELAHLTKQLCGKPVVVHHPSRASGGKFVGGDSKRVGRIDNAWIEGDWSYGDIIVDDAVAVHEIHSGANELSLGYKTDVVDGWDRNGLVDHLAFVEAARCGSECSVRLDSGADRSGGGNVFRVQSMLRKIRNG